MAYALDTNGPIIAAEMRALAAPGKFTVVVLGYNRANNVVDARNTAKQAFRALASIIAGKRRADLKGGFAAAIVKPTGECINYTEAKSEFWS